MLKIALNGCNGRMGRAITELCKARVGMEIVAGFDIVTQKLADYPVYADLMEYAGPADVVLEFTGDAKKLDHFLNYCKERTIPLVLATTGHSDEQMAKIGEAAKTIPVFKSPNMALGISLLADLIKRAAKVLGEGYDVEIIERHHNQKLDAPSGTALMLAREVSSALPYDAEYIYDRHERREKRAQNEVGLHAIRGGTIVGVHEVLFAGSHEQVSITHTAESREVFANGAIRAAQFIVTQKPGLYDMSDLVRSIE